MSIIPSLLITSLFISSLTCNADHFNGAVFNVMSKFDGKKKAVLLSDLKAHDSIRHLHVLAVDIGLGGFGRPNAVGLYYAKIGIGTPPRDYYVQVDTGSDIMWINCVHCQTCLKKGYHGPDLTLYNPNESLTSARVTCNQKFCADINGGTVGGCSPNVSCHEDGSGSLGYFIRDVVQYDSVSGDLETKLANGSVIFGCGASQSGNLRNSEDALDGIIGFGKSNASVISQLASYGKVKKMFAHCLDGENGGGIFAVGHVVQPKVNSTHLIQDQSAYYSVNMTGIKVGTEFLNLTTDPYGKPKKTKTVIDSGTTLAYLPEMIYKPLVKKHGGDVDAVDNVRQTALHWAAVRGSVAAADVLLQNGARVEALDVNGYRAVHVAAQYGQTSFLHYIVSKYHADFDVPDNEGRTPLHWAAYKGFADTIRLLLFWDANQGKQDKEGCTPLHWAALRGHVEACVVLLHAGTKEELMVKDTAGFTPAQIASDRGHRHISLILSNALRAHNSCWKDKGWVKKVGDIGYAPILFCIVFVSTIIFINSVLFASNLLKVTAVVGLWGWTAVSLSVAALLMFVRCSSKDPGYVMSKGIRNNAEAEGPLLTIDLTNTPYWTGNWSQLCPTCKIIRPIRSKHCPSCKRCVEQFDHHCPWISNCVGKKNKWDFFVFLFLGTLTSVISGVVAVHRTWTSIPSLQSEELWIMHVIFHNTGAAVFLFIDFFILLACGTLITVQAYQIARNITTNESVNATRYGYLQGADGRFSNPYNHGVVKNCSDFLIRGYTDDDETAWAPLQQVTSR